jgi:hypothetical protein
MFWTRSFAEPGVLEGLIVAGMIAEFLVSAEHLTDRPLNGLLLCI